MNMPLWKVLPGLLTQWEKMFVVAQFGAATDAIMAATVDGELEHRGVQFIGQSQGMIRDIPTVDELVQRIITEAREVHEEQRYRFQQAEDLPERARTA
jgi:enoyl-[acyl-carrier protein] reductase II